MKFECDGCCTKLDCLSRCSLHKGASDDKDTFFGNCTDALMSAAFGWRCVGGSRRRSESRAAQQLCSRRCVAVAPLLPAPTAADAGCKKPNASACLALGACPVSLMIIVSQFLNESAQE